MKKLLLTVSTLVTFTLCAQNDTLSSFFTGTQTWYTAATGTGYYTGNNSSGDLATMQLFDATYGVTGGGTINEILLAVITAAGTGSFQVAIWDDISGEPNPTPLAIQTVSLPTVDVTAWQPEIGATGSGKWYNASVTFTTPVAIPAGHSFWAGVIYPTATTDTIALWSNTDGDFADSPTHTRVVHSDLTAVAYGGAIALSVFPVVHFVGSAGLSEIQATSNTIYPNPTNGILKFNLPNNPSSIGIFTLDGKLMLQQEVSSSQSQMDVSSLSSGVYMCQVTNADGSIVTNRFTKN